MPSGRIQGMSEVLSSSGSKVDLGDAGQLSSMKEVEKEIDLILQHMRAFVQYTPDRVIIEAAGFSARLLELEVLTHRQEREVVEWKKVRTMQIAKMREELHFQARMASRLVEVSRQDIETQKISGGY